MRLPIFRKLIADQKGASAIMIVLMAAVLIAFASLGVEVVLALKTQRDMQSAADSAVLAAVTANKATYPSPTTEAYSVAAKAGFTKGQGAGCNATPTVTLTTPPCDGPNSGTAGYYEMLIRDNFPLRLAKVVTGQDFVVH